MKISAHPISAPDLLPATYRVSVAASGFAETTVPEVALGSGEERTLDLHLQPARSLTA
jgi:hypothetical protein